MAPLSGPVRWDGDQAAAVGAILPLPKTLYIQTYGCQMNVYDSARMADVLAPHGYRVIDGPEDADLVILNTCHIREKAAEKIYSELGRLRQLKEARMGSGRGMTIAVGGCVAQAEGEEMRRRAPCVDIVFGPQTYHRLPEMLATAARRLGVLETEFPIEPKFDHLPTHQGDKAVSEFLTIQEGCDKFCTFCVVPYTRGAEFSRPVADIVNEARALVDAGTREITLLGQNVNAYRGIGEDGAPTTLGGLLFRLAAIAELARLRYTTSHPRDMHDELLAAHRDVEAVMPFLHLPAQSGADSILAAMNRRHTADDYRRTVDRLRYACPEIALSSDFIVGFPGETDADFAATLALVRDVGFAQAYSFKYSRRPGTPAAAMLRQVPDAEKGARLSELQALLDSQQRAFNHACRGETMPVLLERRGRKEGQLVGRSPFMQAVHVRAGDALCGRVVAVHIDAVHANSLSGAVVSPLVEPGRQAHAA